MELSERVPLAKLTTFRLGGPARGVASCRSLTDLREALEYARAQGLPWYVIGGGSNILASDAGYDGLLIHPQNDGVAIGELSEITGREILAVAGAGALWDAFVSQTIAYGLWGLENLAGIPGSVGGAPVQNIGAYGTDISQTLVWVEAFDTATGELRHFGNDECAFSYRDSLFKRNPSFIIVRVAFALSKNGTPHLDYADLKREVEAGVVLDSPAKIAVTVREIRGRKFPDLAVAGTAGSFFKNATISKEAFDTLAEKYPGFPGYEAEGGMKISVAWILDKILNLRGYSTGNVRLFENQPLVIVAEQGATARDVDALARDVEQRVLESTGITLEREVRML